MRPPFSLSCSRSRSTACSGPPTRVSIIRNLRCIRWLLCALPFACVNKGAFIFLQSIGKPVSSTLLSLLREIVGGVGLVLLLPCFFGLNGILYFMAAAELMTFAAVLPVLRTTAVRLRRLQPQGL